MPVRTIHPLTAAIALAIVVVTHAHAETSEPEQQELQRLSSMCQQDPTYRSLSEQAKGGSSRAANEATAAMIQCFYDNADSRVPAAQKQEWLRDIEANKRKAERAR